MPLGYPTGLFFSGTSDAGGGGWRQHVFLFCALMQLIDFCFYLLNLKNFKSKRQCAASVLIQKV